MLTKNQKKWVEALRSGEFRQIDGYLELRGGYCALGVACCVYEGETQDELNRDCYGEYRGGSLSDDYECVKNWLGLRHPEGVYGVESISGLNDEGYDFDSIANVIESEPEGLFIKQGDNNE